MKILWVLTTPFYRTPDGKGITSDLASARYRVLAPASYLNECSHQVTLAVVNDSTPQSTLDGIWQQFDFDMVVFSKSTLSSLYEQLAIKARQKGAVTVFDVCDPHFEDVERGPYYRALAQAVDLVTCNTQAMQHVVRRYSNAPCEVVDDPYESTRVPARFAPEKRLKLLWFGSPGNLDSLGEAIPQLFAAAATADSMDLSVVTSPASNMSVPDWCRLVQEISNGKLKVQFLQWSLQVQQREMIAADLVIIPSRDHLYKHTKSANRMVESLMSGRMVVAHPQPAYEPFGQWAWIGNDLAEGIRWTLENASSITERISGAQDYIEQHYPPSVIGKKWEHVLTSTHAYGLVSDRQSS